MQFPFFRTVQFPFLRPRCKHCDAKEKLTLFIDAQDELVNNSFICIPCFKKKTLNSSQRNDWYPTLENVNTYIQNYLKKNRVDFLTIEVRFKQDGDYFDILVTSIYKTPRSDLTITRKHKLYVAPWGDYNTNICHIDNEILKWEKDMDEIARKISKHI